MKTFNTPKKPIRPLLCLFICALFTILSLLTPGISVKGPFPERILGNERNEIVPEENIRNAEEMGDAAGDETPVTFRCASILNNSTDTSFSGFNYSDRWFLKKSSEYNHNLASMSLGLAMSAFDSNEDSANPDRNVKALLLDLGFDRDSYSAAGFGSPDSSSAAAAFSLKTIEGSDGTSFPLLAVSLRGMKYGLQGWSDNADVGYSLEVYHSGFLKAADQVYDRLLGYLRANHIGGENLRVWIAGFERSAPIAGILAEKLRGSDLSIPKDRIYAYTFAGMNYYRGTVNDGAAFHLEIPDDFFPFVVPFSWGYSREGTTFMLPPLSMGNTPTKYAAAVSRKYSEILSSETSSPGILSSYASCIPAPYQQALVSWFQYALMEAVPERGDYTYYSLLNLSPEGMAKTFLKQGRDFSVLGGLISAKPLMQDLTAVRDARLENDGSAVLSAVNSLISKTDAIISGLYLIQNSQATMYRIALFAQDVLKGARREVETGLLSDGGSTPNLDLLLTAADTLDSVPPRWLESSHFSETFLAYMAATGEADLKPDKTFASKTLIVTGNVDVSVFGKDGRLLASIEGSRALMPEGSPVSAGIMGENDRVILLPKGTSCTIEIRVLSQGSLKRVLLENNLDNSVAHRENFSSISVTRGQILQMEIDCGEADPEGTGEDPSPDDPSPDNPSTDTPSQNSPSQGGSGKEDSPQENGTDSPDQGGFSRPVYGAVPEKTVIVGGKIDVKAFLEKPPGKKIRYVSSDKKTASVNRKGIVKGKRAGTVEITLKRKNGSSSEILGSCTLQVEKPVMEKRKTVVIGKAASAENSDIMDNTAADSGSFNACDLISCTRYAPTSWISTNPKTASVKEDGTVLIHGKGKTRIVAVYGKGKLSTRRKYRTVLTVRE